MNETPASSPSVNLLNSAVDAFGWAQQALFEHLVQPLMFAEGLGNLLEDGYQGTGWLLVGLLQITLLVTVVGALQRWRPVEPVTDRRAVRVDVIYTLVHRLGLFRLVLFFTLEPLVWELVGELRLLGVRPWQLDAIWPGVTDTALVSFVLYLLLFDLVDYLIHRGQHHWHWWWQLHALHHSQRQMTMWSDNRNHLLDDVIRDVILVATGFALGVGPGQFIAIIACTQLLESLSHANVRMGFGPVLGRVLVSPAFHRLHHRIGLGHESAGPGSLGGHNFAVLFPLWDHLFGTARADGRYEPTGIRDQLPADGARDYGQSFWAQQWLGLKRLAGRA
jgi:sterol desaturase/sphingolipid hydroxylase (fatty acid hydroxylase superfamily)